MSEKQVLDATCGGRTIWLPENKENENTLYIDRREEPPEFHGQEGRSYAVEPDEVQDFRDLPYDDGSFNLVVFDPPHEIRDGGMEALTGYVSKKYGALEAETWQEDLRSGFEELFRVLSSGGTLVFKFADNSIQDWKRVIDLAPRKPMLGTTTKKNNTETRWFVFYKPEQ